MIDTARFGLLLFCVDGPLAGHIPFVLHRAQGRFGTLARHLGDGHEALAVFSGPRAYVSPRWYSDGGLPTYNFLAVHALGRPRLLEDRDAVLHHLAELVSVHEWHFAHPWLLASASADHVAELLPHIVAFTLEIDSLQGKRKLSQNRSPADRYGVIRELSARGSDDDRAIATAMAAHPYAAPD